MDWTRLSEAWPQNRKIRRPLRWPARRRASCQPWRRHRRRIFFCPHAIRGGVPPPSDGVELAEHRRGLFPGPVRLIAARAADQRILPAGRGRADLPPRSDGGPGLRAAHRRMALSVSLAGWRLAPEPVLVRGGPLLPVNQPLGVGRWRR